MNTKFIMEPVDSLSDPEAPAYVKYWELESGIAGVVHLEGEYNPKNHTAIVDYIETNPKGKGIGTKAIREAECFLSDRGARRITAWAVATTKNFWERMGYTLGKKSADGMFTYVFKEIPKRSHRTVISSPVRKNRRHKQVLSGLGGVR